MFTSSLRASLICLWALLLLLSPAAVAQDEVGDSSAPHQDPATTRVRPACPEAIAARASVVVLKRGERLVGAGFLFGDSKTIVTANHVLEVGIDAATDIHGGRYTIRSFAVAPGNDIALVRLDRALEVGKPLLPATDVVVGQELYLIGHPVASTDDFRKTLLEFSIGRGIVGGISEEWLQSDVVPAGGYSGGPLVTCDGRVAGVMSHTLPRALLSFAGRISVATRIYETGKSVSGQRLGNTRRGRTGLAFAVGRNREYGLALSFA